MGEKYEKLPYKDSAYFKGASKLLEDLNEIRMTKLDKAQAMKLSLIIEKECKVVVFVLQNEEAIKSEGEEAFWEAYYNTLRSVKQFIKEDIRQDKQVKYLKHLKPLEDKVPTKIKEMVDKMPHLY